METAKRLIIILIAIALASCTKKQQTEIATPKNESQTAENEISANEEQIENGTWSEEDKQIIEDLKRKIDYGKEGLTPVEPMGIYKIRYQNNGREKMVLAPIATISETDLKENVAAYEKYSSLLNAETQPRPNCYSTNEVTAIACKEKGNGENTITIFFSATQGESWNIAKIEIDSEFIRGGRHLQFKIFCPNADTGYLIMYCTDDEVFVKGGHIFRTQNAGASWEQIGELPDAAIRDLFAQGGTVFLNAKKGKFFCVYKSGDCKNWEELNFPIDTENYDNGSISSFYFEDNYGIVKSGLFNPNLERRFFATNDCGKTWTSWE